MQTILGAGGVIGKELSRHLSGVTPEIRQVSRNPVPVNEGDACVRADLLDREAVARALEGSEIAYLVAGLPYDARVWESDWPRIMENVIEGCARHRVKLVFFDNVYAYGRVEGAMTEDTPFNPCSRKGEVRARIATRLMEAHAAGTVEAMIVRAADFYGPGAVLSFPHSTVFERLRKGKKPQWIGDASRLHSFTFTPDAGRATALLGNRPDAYGRSWHALTAPDPLTGEDFVRLACQVAGRPVDYQPAPGWLLTLMGLFVPVLRENREMMYQFEHDYRFDSSRTAVFLGAEATSYAEGIRATFQMGMDVTPGGAG